MTRLAVIGCGALGSRHLQALARLAGPMRIDLVDPLAAAREKAIGLLTEAGGLRGELKQADHIDELKGAPDIAIVATNARERLAAVRRLCAAGCPALILEKVLFTRRDEYAEAQAAIDAAGARAWVNCVRRTAPRVHRLQELIAGRPIDYRVEGQDWGLACNVIHHLDEWLWLAGGQAATLSGSFEPALVPARRPGYFELLGTLRGTAGSSRFEAACGPDKGPQAPGDRVVAISFDDVTLRIGQASQDLTIRRGADIVAREPYPTAMQSEATAWHVATILAGGEPALPRYAESAQLHLAMFDAMQPHFQSIDPSLTECPIT